MRDDIVIDCPHCNVRVTAAMTSCVYDPTSDENSRVAYFLVECPSCKMPLLGTSQPVYDSYKNWTWDTAERLWPNARNAALGPAIPEAAKRDIRDAEKCLKQGIYSATAVLAGRALERIVKDKTGERTIARGLKKLLDQEIIDKKLFSWADALRKERNLGAHAVDEDITRDNAKDVLDFTVAIYDYVYTLTDKFNQFMKRKGTDEAAT